MIAKKIRLTGSKNFTRVQKEGKMFQSVNFGIAYIDRKDESPSRFAFVVSTKIAKAAVDRNRFKRAMGEAVRIESSRLQPGYDVVFLAKTLIVRIPTSEIMKEVVRALTELAIVK